MILKCLVMKGCSWVSWPPGKTEYAVLQALRNILLSSNSPPSFRGGLAAICFKHRLKNQLLVQQLIMEKSIYQARLGLCCKLPTCHTRKWSKRHRAPQANTKVGPVKFTEELQEAIKYLHMGGEGGRRERERETERERERERERSKQNIKTHWLDQDTVLHMLPGQTSREHSKLTSSGPAKELLKTWNVYKTKVSRA